MPDLRHRQARAPHRAPPAASSAVWPDARRLRSDAHDDAAAKRSARRLALPERVLQESQGERGLWQQVQLPDLRHGQARRRLGRGVRARLPACVRLASESAATDDVRYGRWEGGLLRMRGEGRAGDWRCRNSACKSHAQIFEDTPASPRPRCAGLSRRRASRAGCACGQEAPALCPNPWCGRAASTKCTRASVPPRRRMVSPAEERRSARSSQRRCLAGRGPPN
mmetsp:Transcript_88764/g.248393  ORF Transcript_88764/g.248393 Transcript_88764/m.248393 type:complete len:224 (-) Transcript_88764:91-762(-)